MSTERLLEIKGQIDDAKNKKAGVEGQIEGVEGQAQTKFKVRTLASANEKLKKMGAELDKKETAQVEGEEKLEAAYPWE